MCVQVWLVCVYIWLAKRKKGRRQASQCQERRTNEAQLRGLFFLFYACDGTLKQQSNSSVFFLCFDVLYKLFFFPFLSFFGVTVHDFYEFYYLMYT